MTYQILVKGTVQGVGFRPFVYNLAQKHNIAGYILNNTIGVEITAQGKKYNLDNFRSDLQEKAPPRSVINSIETSRVSDHQENFASFKIKNSQNNSRRQTHIAPDLNVCEDCLEELFDPTDRRYLYPFINCTNCGPRFTIIQDIPYDRPATTMQEFEMCPECKQEYSQPSERRFHAQPNACFTCGPTLSLYDNSNNLLESSKNAAEIEQLFQKMAGLLEDGEILSIKSNGGFHLACNALDEETVVKLRQKKYRYEKALAVMFPTLESISDYCYIAP